MTADNDLDDTTSTVNATHGTARTVRDFEETPFIWGQNEINESQVNDLDNRRNKELEEYAGNHFPYTINPSAYTPTNTTLATQESQPTIIPSPFTTQIRFILVFLTSMTFLSLGIAIHTIHLARNKAIALKEAKLTLLLTTHVVAVCAALGAVVVRRTPTEALLYFVVIVLLGNMVRREAECFL